MPRPVWRGHITFALVNVPVNLYPAEQRTDLQLHMLDSRDHSRVRYERVNEETGEEVPWNSVVRGYEYSEGSYIVLGEAELRRAAPEATRAIEIENFVERCEIDPIFFDKPYYVEPDKSGVKGYSLLREAMLESDRVGIARVVIRTRQYIAALLARRDVLVLSLLRYAQELRPVDALELPPASAQGKVSAVEKKTARMLIEGMSARWEPSKYHDEYREELMTWIRKRIEAGKADQPVEAAAPESEEVPGPINFMELLRKSMAQKGIRTPSTRKARPAPRRRAPGQRRAG